MTNILLIGGAGYIGSHMVKCLNQQNFNVTVLDLSPTHPNLKANWIHGNCGDPALLQTLFKQHAIDAVMHFGAYIQVGESVQKPDIYYQNNFVNTLNLLDAMREANVDKFIFSSTAALFGKPHYSPIDEQHPIAPINPYGHSKAMVEQILKDYGLAYGLKSICFRYFNAAGADPDGELGECHEPESHLIPLVLQVAAGRREQILIYGDDYDTPDGTCLRDYIHVMDLCEAHLLGLKKLLIGSNSAQYNLGNGNGFSVKEVIDVACDVTGVNIKSTLAPRRDGDAARLIADSTAAIQCLGWQPKYADLTKIITDAWHWEQKLAAR